MCASASLVAEDFVAMGRPSDAAELSAVALTFRQT